MLIGLGNMLKNTLPIKRILSAFRFAAYRKMKRALLNGNIRLFAKCPLTAKVTLHYFSIIAFGVVPFHRSIGNDLIVKISIVHRLDFFARSSALPLSNVIPFTRSSINSGMPPIRAPSTGVPKHSASITDKGLFSYHSEGITVNLAFPTMSFMSSH